MRILIPALSSLFVLAGCPSPTVLDAGPTSDAGQGNDAGQVTCSPLGAACADSSKRCYPVGDGTTGVCSTPGAVALTGACTTVLGNPPECAGGAVCLNFYGQRQCVGVCNVDAGSPACAGGSSCQSANGVPWGVCTPVPDAGSSCDVLGAACADSSKRCYPTDLASGVCATPGTVPALGTCTTTFGNPPECVAQSICLFTQCIQVCNRDGGTPRCTTGPCGNAEGAPWGICQQGTACDPLYVSCDSFLTDMSCFPVGDGTRSVCSPPGTIATGDTCTTVLGTPPECAAGNVCLNVPGGRKCTQVCSLDGGYPTCGTGTCLSASGVPYGLCQ